MSKPAVPTEAVRSKPAGPSTLVYVVVGSVLLLDSLVFLLFLWERFSLAGALAVHALLTAVANVWVWRRARAGNDLRFLLLLVTATALLGPLGAAGTLAAMILRAVFERSSLPFEQWYQALFPEEKSNFEVDLLEAARTQGEEPGNRGGVVSFRDVLSFGTPEQKQAAVAVIAEHFQPSFAPALLQALRDPSNAVRVQASAAIARVENSFHERLMALSKIVEEDPDNPEALQALARHYDDYAYTGLLDPDREAENRRKSVGLYHLYLRWNPQDREARTRLGRSLLRQGAFAEAAACLGEILEQGAATPQSLLWHMECLFRLGSFAELRKAARRRYEEIAGESGLPAHALEAVQTWAASKTATDVPAEALL